MRLTRLDCIFVGMKASSPRDLMFNPIERISMFDQFIKLCKEPSRLGENLLEASLAMGDCSDDHSSGQSKTNIPVS